MVPWSSGAKLPSLIMDYVMCMGWARIGYLWNIFGKSQKIETEKVCPLDVKYLSNSHYKTLPIGRSDKFLEGVSLTTWRVKSSHKSCQRFLDVFQSPNLSCISQDQFGFSAISISFCSRAYHSYQAMHTQQKPTFLLRGKLRWSWGCIPCIPKNDREYATSNNYTRRTQIVLGERVQL